MNTQTFSIELLNLLRSVDTPTIFNAIEVAQGKRGYDGFTRGTILAANHNLPAFCGYARTAKIRGNAPPSEPAAEIRARRMAYYRYMAETPQPSVTVVEDLDYPEATGAYWGEVNTYVHKAFGISGVLTNGVMRDLGDLAPDFQVIAGSIGPSHGFVHVVDIGGPVTVFGLTISDGDFIHADRHGAVLVPPDVLPVLGVAIEKMRRSENIILAPARKGKMTFAEFEEAWLAFEKARV
jgi:regulator of RNase E activity RraA